MTQVSTMLHTTPIPPQTIHDVVKVPLVDVVPEEPVVITRQPTPDLPLLHDLLTLDKLLITKKLRVRNVLFLRGRRNRYLIRTSDQTLIYTIEEENRYQLLPAISPPEMFAKAQVDSFSAIVRKKSASLLARLRGSSNSLLKVIADRLDESSIMGHLIKTTFTSSWWVGYLCYGLRPLQLRVMDREGTEVMRIHRPYACTGRCLPCQLQRLEVYSPPGELIGSVEQQWTPVKPVYLVKKDNGDHLFWIRGPFITVNCFRDVQFEIMRADGTPVGATCKRWQGMAHALFFQPVTDNFGVAFEQDLSVEEKGLLLAATLLMDYMYYDV